MSTMKLAFAAPAPLAGNHPALEWLNTRYGLQMPVETLANGRAYLEWFVRAGMLDSAMPGRLMRRFGATAMDAAAADARNFREWTRQWLSRWQAAPETGFGREFAELNTRLQKTSWRYALASDGPVCRLASQPSIDSTGSLLGLVARSVADLVIEVDPSRIRQCAGAGCTLWFVDRSKSHRRMFCSDRTCGNRHKVAAFRERQR